MAGILKRLKKGDSNKTVAKSVVIRSSAQTESNNASRATTDILTNPNLDLSERSSGIPLTAKETKQISTSEVGVSDKTTFRKSSILNGDDLPDWINERKRDNPNVDKLVTTGRKVLNDLIGEDTTRDELPDLIVEAMRIASKQVSQVARVTNNEIESATRDLISLLLGKGPIQPLYDDPYVTDIYLDSHDSIKCIRKGRALETPFRFRSPEEFEAYISATLQSVDRVLNLSSPIVDCVLNDGFRSRVNAVHRSVLDRNESSMVIRVPRLQHVTFYDLLQTKTLPTQVAAWLAEVMAEGETNVLVVGATGSGKTVFTTALLSAVGSDERICTIEDVPEIFVPTAHLEKLVARPPNAQGRGGVELHELLRAALRRAPHRIVVGEIRDREGPLFLKALETGHLGSCATIHARNSKEGLWRLLDVVAAYERSPQESIMRRISRSVNLVITMQRVNGKPCMTEIVEVRPPVNNEFIVTKLVEFVHENEYGERMWRIKTKYSKLLDKIAKRGVALREGKNLLPPLADEEESGNREFLDHD